MRELLPHQEECIRIAHLPDFREQLVALCLDRGPLRPTSASLFRGDYSVPVVREGGGSLTVACIVRHATEAAAIAEALTEADDLLCGCTAHVDDEGRIRVIDPSDTIVIGVIHMIRADRLHDELAEGLLRYFEAVYDYNERKARLRTEEGA